MGRGMHVDTNTMTFLRQMVTTDLGTNATSIPSPSNGSRLYIQFTLFLAHLNIFDRSKTTLFNPPSHPLLNISWQELEGFINLIARDSLHNVPKQVNYWNVYIFTHMAPHCIKYLPFLTYVCKVNHFTWSRNSLARPKWKKSIKAERERQGDCGGTGGVVGEEAGL